MNETKPKLEVLDALRGFCALAVVALHFTENYAKGHGAPGVPHAYLPVEYFLFLTGFTFVYAYDARWAEGMTVGGFFRRRLLRMHPLVVVGSLFGALLYLTVPELSCMRDGHGFGWFLLGTVWSCTLVPAPACMGWSLTHVMQGPMWTMVWIYFANVLYAVFLRHLRTWMLGVLAVAGVGFYWWADATYGVGNGWRFDARHNVCALARLAFPVFAGMFIARKGWRIRTGKAGLWICLALLACVFVAPLPATRVARAWLDTSLVVGVITLVVLCGIGGTIANPKLAAFCRFMGAYSFPLFATHFPFRVIQKAWILAHPSAPLHLHVAVSLALVFFAFVNAWAAMKLVEAFDRWAKNRALVRP